MIRYRNHFAQRWLQSATTGAVVTNATVTVCKPDTQTPVAQTLYNARNGGSPISNPYQPGDGNLEFYVDRPMVFDLLIQIPGSPNQVMKALEVGSVNHTQRDLFYYGAKVDGVTDDIQAIVDAWGDMEENGYLWHPPTGLPCMIGSELAGAGLTLPTVDGFTLDAPCGSQLRLPPFRFQAMPGAGLHAIAATREYWLDGDCPQDPQGGRINGIGWDGGGYRSGDNHQNDPKETSANTEYGLIMHGTGWTLEDPFQLSANVDGIYIPHLGISGSELSHLTGSHENRIMGGSARYCGRSGLHAGELQQDMWISMFRPSFAGLHTMEFEAHAGITLIQCHPTFAGGDLIHSSGGWPLTVMGCYDTLIGEYLDNTGYPGTHYGLWVHGGVIVIGNKFNINPDVQQIDPTAGYYFENGPITYMGNSLLANPLSNAHEMDVVNVPLNKRVGWDLNYVSIG